MPAVFQRHIEKTLLKWKNASKRKPLVLRGARQVGKTTIAKRFSKNYKHHIYLNLEKSQDIQFFEKWKDTDAFIEAISLSKGIPSKELKNTLLFIDEIQESPEALSMLRYFYEDYPQLHVITAGSLLEQVMGSIKKVPVGRVEYLYIYPLNFEEYLMASNHQRALDEIKKIPISNYAHQTLKEIFHEYGAIGGMPEVVDTYLKTRSYSDLTSVYESLWMGYKDDIEKYAKNKTEGKVIKHVMETAYTYVDSRIKFQNFGNSNYRSREVGEAMRNLQDARIIQLLYPSTSVKPPIKPDYKKAPRMQYIDTGLLNHNLNAQIELMNLEDLNDHYRGAIVSHLITQELISLNTQKYSVPKFWVRQKNQSQAEVDLIFHYMDKIIPIEIKSGKEGTLRSLHQFIERSDHPYAIRMYAGEFKVEQHITPTTRKPYLLMNMPYYLGTKIPQYIEYFLNNHSL